ncbi:hypothetical protein FSP39_012195 [Pinctada imbricata]|uniref:IRG-type G domain-containing protein n=1 Tax=Pinctada imbricata TaxID=66713 RepID=A0AA89BRU3_PINIB|nr:hypothetical protein FSP39_012195 [Pinctada imbricata]
MEAMKSTKLSIAVMGPSCVGKSSFINNMLGLKEGDLGAATVGDGDTTQIRKAYSHPQIKQLEYYDLPGFGTPFFKMTDNYLREIKVESYDFFLIFYSGTISEGDVWIIQKLLDMKKMFALVRTRADEMKRRAKPLNQSIMEAKDRCETNLREFGIKVKVPTFIISNIDINIGEMNKLFRFIQSSLPELKRKAITLYVQAKTDEIIAQKEEQLLDNAWVAALCMGVATGLPLPGVDIPINYVLLGAEIKSCLLSFGLSAEMFERIPEDVKIRMKTTSAIHKGGVKGYILLNITKIPTIISCALVQEAVEICLPVVGSLITGSVAFVFYLNFLRSIIRKLANEARILRRIYLESVV